MSALLDADVIRELEVLRKRARARVRSVSPGLTPFQIKTVLCALGRRNAARLAAAAAATDAAAGGASAGSRWPVSTLPPGRLKRMHDSAGVTKVRAASSAPANPARNHRVMSTSMNPVCASCEDETTNGVPWSAGIRNATVSSLIHRDSGPRALKSRASMVVSRLPIGVAFA